MLELIEMGLLDAFFFSGYVLTAVNWAFAALGFLIQYQVTKRCKNVILRWIFPGLLLAGVIWGEYGMWTVTGWDRLGIIFLYWPVACLALGALAGWLVAWYRGKRQDQDIRGEDHV